MFRRLSPNTFHTFKFLAGVDGTFSSQKKHSFYRCRSLLFGHCESDCDESEGSRPFVFSIALATLSVSQT